MELIRISLDKIKISLSKAELDAYDLTVDSIDYGQGKTKEAFRELFVEARERTGFEADGEKVFVQIFRAKNGGCEIFISKIEKEKKSEKRISAELFCFEELETLISACKTLIDIGFCKKSDVYSENERLYLVLYSPCEIESACVSEYAEKSALPTKEYINEHFVTVRKNDAVAVLSKL